MVLDYGLWLRSEKQGKPNNTKISRWPFHLLSVSRAERGGDFYVTFKLGAPHMHSDITISSAVFFSSQGMPELHRKGAVIHEPDLLRDYVRKEMDKYNTDNAPSEQFSQFGWKDKDTAFLVGDKLYTHEQILPAVLIPEVERRARRLGPHGGSLGVSSSVFFDRLGDRMAHIGQVTRDRDTEPGEEVFRESVERAVGRQIEHARQIELR